MAPTAARALLAAAAAEAGPVECLFLEEEREEAGILPAAAAAPAWEGRFLSAIRRR